MYYFRQFECVEKVNIMKTDKPEPFSLEWKKSTVFKCTAQLQKVNPKSNIWYYSLNLTNDSVKDKDEYKIDSLVIESSKPVEKGDIEVVPYDYSIKQYDKIGKLEAGKCTRITRDYPETEVGIHTPLCKVKKEMVDIDAQNQKATLKEGYLIYFDIFVRCKKSTKFKCKKFQEPADANEWLFSSLKLAKNDSNHSLLDDNKYIYFFESLEISSTATCRTEKVGSINYFRILPFSGIINDQVHSTGIQVTTDTPLCQIHENLVDKEQGGNIFLRDGYEINFNIIVKKKYYTTFEKSVRKLH